ncbi:hypothetical protein [Desulfoluna sp.]|uniref:hypothetical protein n=1 Tax=Desulfoluna sp. TaxID=2045199 RepID=UPI00262114E8|nr:hypothetical protein [Desulfoluna sp.]
MGTDINLYAEKKVGDKWVLATGMEKNEWYDPNNPLKSEFSPIQIEVGRNYDLFALLAGVRNYSDVESISDPRGLPNDVCQEISAEYKTYEDASFSPSWLLVSELEQFDWEKVIQKEGMVDKHVANLFAGNPMGFPVDKWPKDIQCSYARWKRDGVSVRWREKAIDISSWYLLKDKVDNLCNNLTIRFVFWFDM